MNGMGKAVGYGLGASIHNLENIYAISALLICLFTAICAFVKECPLVTEENLEYIEDQALKARKRY